MITRWEGKALDIIGVRFVFLELDVDGVLFSSDTLVVTSAIINYFEPILILT